MMSEQESRRPNPDENEFPVFILLLLLLFCVRVCFPPSLVITFYCAFLTLRGFLTQKMLLVDFFFCFQNLIN